MTPQPLPQQMIGFSGGTTRKKRWDEEVPWLEFADGKWMNLRFFGNSTSILTMVATHWLETLKGKRFPMLCLNYDSTESAFTKTGCPVCDEFDPRNSEVQGIKDISARFSGYTHAIDRDIQEAGGVGADWKAWRPVRLPISVIIALQNLKGRNVHTINGKKYEADVADPYYGRDVAIKYDPYAANPQAKYTTDKGDHTPLSDEEAAYIPGLYDFLSMIEYPTESEVKKALQQNGYYQMLNGEEPTTQTVVGGVPTVDLAPQAPQPPSAPVVQNVAPAPFPVGGMSSVQAEPEAHAQAQAQQAQAFRDEDIPFAPIDSKKKR